MQFVLNVFESAHINAREFMTCYLQGFNWLCHIRIYCMINSKLDNITLDSLKEVQPCDFMFLTYLHISKGQIRNIRLSIILNMYFKCSKENRLVKIEAVLLSTDNIIIFG